MRLTAGGFCLSSLCDEPGDDFVAVISLDFNDAMLARSPRSAMALERLGNLVDFSFIETVHETHDARPPSLTRNSNDAVVRHRLLR